MVGGAQPQAIGTGRTLSEWYVEYWPVIEASIRPRTVTAYDVGWRLRVKPTLGSRRMRDITPTVIESAMTDWSGSSSTKIDALAVLSRLLRGAHQQGLIGYNPARSISRPEVDEVDPRSRALTKEEVDLVLHMIPEGVYRRYAAALAYTGGRAGEATAARVVDVDLPGRVIRVRRSISPGRHGELIEQTPKSHKWRPVPIVDDFVPYVEEAMEGKKPQERLFAGVRGGRLTNKTFVRAVNWPKIRKALHRPDFKVKDLRHTFATLLFDAGVSAPDVQQAMGHSSLQVTELYSRSRDNATAGTGRRLSVFLRGSQTPGGSPSSQDAPARPDPPSL